MAFLSNFDAYEKKLDAKYTEEIQACGTRPPDKILQHFNTLNIFLLVVAVVIAVVLIWKNRKSVSALLHSTFSFLKKHFLSVLFILLILALFASLSITEHQWSRFVRNAHTFRSQFYYTYNEPDKVYADCTMGAYGRAEMDLQLGH